MKTIKILLGLSLLLGLIFYFFFYTRIDIEIKKIDLLFNEKANIKDYIKVKDGKVYSHLIKTNKLGKNTYKVKVENKFHYTKEIDYTVNIKDKTAPLIFVSENYVKYAPYNENLLESIMIGDNDTNKVKTEIIGDYDGTKIGTYPLTIVATDNSNNKSEAKINLIIKERTKNNNSSKIELTPFNEYKTRFKNNKIGIDISKWQGNVDFKKIKNADVDFVMIRAGVQKGYGEQPILDEKFTQNIENALKENIDVGLYFYSCATSKKEAKEQAEWVLKQIKNYKVTLPIAFDWENWQYFNKAQLSFYDLTQLAESFMKEIKKNGYDTLLYGSKNYLEKVWLETSYDKWLAHYNKETNYKGNYKLWQITESATVDGIKGAVDVNVMY